MNFIEIEELDYIDYLLFKRDAFIWKQSQTEHGLEYLENAYRLEQTNPNRKELRRFKKGGE